MRNFAAGLLLAVTTLVACCCTPLAPAYAQRQTYTSVDHLSGVSVDQYTPLPVQGGGAINVTGKIASCSTTIALGGTPQDLMPSSPAGVPRGGYKVQNQSSGPIYIRSKSATGTLVATPDQNSFMVPVGGFFEPDEVSDYAYSVYGATTGQAIHCNRW